MTFESNFNPNKSIKFDDKHVYVKTMMHSSGDQKSCPEPVKSFYLKKLNETTFEANWEPPDNITDIESYIITTGINDNDVVGQIKDKHANCTILPSSIPLHNLFKLKIKSKGNIMGCFVYVI